MIPADLFRKSRTKYPQLCAYDCSNFFSNVRYGFTHKINLYNCTVDKLQVDFSQMPMKHLKTVIEIFKILQSQKRGVDIGRKFSDLQAAVEAEIGKLMVNVQNYATADSPVRAEFRFPLNRVVPMMNLMEYYFSKEFLREYLFVFESTMVSELLQHYVKLLSQPMVDALCTIATNWNDETDRNVLVSCIPTIAAFGGLLENTLFSGSDKTYVPKIIFNVATDMNSSLDLKRTMRSHNRLVFNGEKWNSENRLIEGSNKLLMDICQKYRIPDFERICKTFRILTALRKCLNPKEKAMILWMAYFEHLWRKRADDFDFYGVAEDAEKLKLGSVQSRKKQVPITFEMAVSMVFGVNRLELCMAENLSVWMLPHMLGYYEMSKRPAEKQALDAQLLVVIRELGAEYIHFHGDHRNFFADRTFHWYLKVAPIRVVTVSGRPIEGLVRNRALVPALAPTTLPVPVPVQRQSNAASSNPATAAASLENDRPVTLTGNVGYSQAEKVMFVKGLNTFKDCSHIFAKIQSCEELGFDTGELSGGKLRTNVNLKDLKRTLTNNGTLRMDPVTKLYFLTSSSIEECRGLDYNTLAATIREADAASIREAEAASRPITSRRGRGRASTEEQNNELGTATAATPTPELAVEYTFTPVTATTRCYLPTPRFADSSRTSLIFTPGTSPQVTQVVNSVVSPVQSAEGFTNVSSRHLLNPTGTPQHRNDYNSNSFLDIDLNEFDNVYLQEERTSPLRAEEVFSPLLEPRAELAADVPASTSVTRRIAEFHTPLRPVDAATNSLVNERVIPDYVERIPAPSTVSKPVTVYKRAKPQR